jgi:hypothetical protein
MKQIGRAGAKGWILYCCPDLHGMPLQGCLCKDAFATSSARNLARQIKARPWRFLERFD